MLSPTGSLVSTSNQSGSAKSPSDQSTPTNGDRNPFTNGNGSDAAGTPHQDADKQQCLKEVFSPSSDMNRLQLASDLSPAEQQQHKHLHQPRNRLGLLLPLNVVEIPSPTSDTTPTQTPVQQPRSKQGSPFYAEPADALGNVIRRSQRGPPIAPAHRHSEPPKGPVRLPLCQVLSPIESEKSHHISGSLDELKKKNRKARGGRIDPWPVDSSWEFLGNDDQNDYDTDVNWKNNNTSQKNEPNGNNTIKNLQTLPPRDQKLTLNQIIAKRLPDMKIPELVFKSALPISVLPPDTPRSEARNGGHRQGSRMSSYDNVERGHSGYATTSIFNQSSAHSDDGTVFSEPWDSSQWDSFLPHGDGKLKITNLNGISNI